MRVIAVLFLLLSFPLFIAAQEEPSSFCGTTETDPWLEEFFQNRALYQRENFDPVFIPLTIHILGTDEGTGYFPAHTLYESLCTLNSDFEETGMQFYIQEPIRYINRTEWYDHPSFGAGIDMMVQNNIPGTANCYIVANPAGNCGYYAGSGNAIALSKGCTDPADHTWAHELGHFFSLPHTFVGWEGIRWEIGKTAVDYQGQVRREIERVTGTNCQSAADRFCDTPPDYLSYRWSCNGNALSNEVMVDPDSAQFRSDGSLFMSYSNDACMQRFSFEQMEAMLANLSTRRSELIKDSFPLVDLGQQTVEIAFPSDSALVNHVGLTASWEAVPGATHYIVEVSRLANFNFIISRERVSGTSFEFPELRPGIRYFWRIKAVNANSFCTPYSETFVFVTSRLTGTNDLFSAGEWHLNGSAFYSGDPISMQFDLKTSMVAKYQLISINGTVLLSENIDISSGIHQYEIPISGRLAPGQYLLHLHTDAGSSVRRFVVIN